MRVYLVNSNLCREEDRKSGHLPLALLSLGAMLEKNGYIVKIVDLEELLKQKKLTIDDNFHNNAASIIVNGNIDVLGFNTRCDTYPSVLNIAKRCKELNPSCAIIFGGPQATLLDIETLQNFKFVDIIIRGEAELTIIELMDKLKKRESLQHIAGITYRGLEGKIVRNPDRKPIEDLDSLPYPAYHLMEGYRDNGDTLKDRWIYIEGGRGCPYNCTFCSAGLLHKKTYRMRNPEGIIKEMSYLKKRYGIRNFSFLYEHFLFDKKRIIKICNILIRRKLNLYWTCRSRPDHLTPGLTRIMARAGCKGIYLGIESGSRRIQRSIRKHIDVSAVPALLAECEKYKIRIIASFIIGFPDEKEEDINATLRLALKCSLFKNCFVRLYLLAPMPKTVLLARYKDKITFSGFFSNVIDGKLAYLKENLHLIKKYPSMFSIYYMIKPEYIPDNLPYNATRIFSSFMNIHSLSCHIAIRESGITPMELFQGMYNKLRSKTAYRRDLSASAPELRKIFPLAMAHIYKQKNLNFKVLKYIIDFEDKRFNGYNNMSVITRRG